MKQGKNIELEIIQKPASWAKVKLKKTSLKAGEKGSLMVSAAAPYDKARHTSTTIEATAGTKTYRFTVAIRTGPSGYGLSKIKAPKK